MYSMPRSVSPSSASAQPRNTVPLARWPENPWASEYWMQLLGARLDGPGVAAITVE